MTKAALASLVLWAALWRTFLRNHAPDIAAMDLFIVPSIGFGLLYGHRRKPRRA
jgi:hypothetical protein